MDSAIVVPTNACARPKAGPGIIDMHNLAITRTLAYIAGQLGQREWCEGDSITLADLALVSALVYLDLRQAERDWRGAHPELAHFSTA